MACTGPSWTRQTEADLDVVSKANLTFFVSGHTGSQVTAEWQIPRLRRLSRHMCAKCQGGSDGDQHSPRGDGPRRQRQGCGQD